MTTLKRLSDDDVRAVFQSLHEGKPPPSHLQFQIVPVGPRGLKLSPPSHEFADGLYVLLRPQKKKKNVDVQPKVPEHLQHLVMRNLPPETCPWSLSGPQFPTPTTIQQRYCYPKGRLEYSSRKGGALWTMYDSDGKEDTEFRLLHVYLSPKRAANKGVDLSKEEKASLRNSASTFVSSSNKKMRYTRGKAASSVHPNSLNYIKTGHTNKVASSGSPQTSAHSISYHGTAMVSSPPSLSPLSFDRLQPPSSSPATTPGSHYHHNHHYHHVPVGNPKIAPYYLQHHEQRQQPQQQHQQHQQHQHYSCDKSEPTFVTPVHGNLNYSTDSSKGPPSISGKHTPFRNNPDNHNIHQSPLQRTSFLDDPRADPFWGEGDDSCCMDASSFHEMDMMLWPEPFALTGPTDSNNSSVSSNDPAAGTTLDASNNNNHHHNNHHPQNRHHHHHHQEHQPHHHHRRTSSSSSSSAMMIMGVTADPPPAARCGGSHVQQHPPPSQGGAEETSESMAAVLGKSSSSPSTTTTKPTPQNLVRRLEHVQNYLRECLLSSSATPQEQAALVSIVVGWARHLASDPLGEPTGSNINDTKTRPPHIHHPCCAMSNSGDDNTNTNHHANDAHENNHSCTTTTTTAPNANNNNANNSGLVVDDHLHYHHQSCPITNSSMGGCGTTSRGENDKEMIMMMSGVGANKCFLSPSTSLETPAGSKEEPAEDDDDASSVIRMSSSPPTAV